jgi:hypothetical protein
VVGRALGQIRAQGLVGRRPSSWGCAGSVCRWQVIAAMAVVLLAAAAAAVPMCGAGVGMCGWAACAPDLYTHRSCTDGEQGPSSHGAGNVWGAGTKWQGQPCTRAAVPGPSLQRSCFSGTQHLHQWHICFSSKRSYECAVIVTGCMLPSDDVWPCCGAAGRAWCWVLAVSGCAPGWCVVMWR